MPFLLAAGKDAVQDGKPKSGILSSEKVPCFHALSLSSPFIQSRICEENKVALRDLTMYALP